MMILKNNFMMMLSLLWVFPKFLIVFKYLMYHVFGNTTLQIATLHALNFFAGDTEAYYNNTAPSIQEYEKYIPFT